MIGFTRLIPLLTRRECFRISVSTRQKSLITKLARIQPETSLSNRQNHKVVYNFRLISLCGSVIRLKYSLPVINAIGLFGYYLVTPDLLVLSTAVVISLVNLVLVHVLSKFLVNTVGRIYVNQKGDIEEVIVSVVDKAGRKRDYKHSSNSIYILDPYTRIQEMFNIYPLMVKESKTIYKLYFTRCDIADIEAAKTLFGKGNLNKIQMLRRKKKE